MTNIDAKSHPRIRQYWTAEELRSGSPVVANVHERWLEFIDERGQLERFIPRLQSRPAQRDEALAEIAVAYFLEERCCLPIVEWEPPVARGNNTGEFMVALPSGRMFVEVKARGWESEVMTSLGVKDKAKAIDRVRQPKYARHPEVWTTPPWRSVRDTIERAYRQVPSGIPTLLVIHDDLFLPLNRWPHELVEASLLDPRDGSFVGSRFERLGAVGILNIDYLLDDQFLFRIYDNPNCASESVVHGSLFSEYRAEVQASSHGLDIGTIRRLCPGPVPSPGSLSDGLDASFLPELFKVFPDPTPEQIANFYEMEVERHRRR
jgi:hypothetical protein